MALRTPARGRWTRGASAMKALTRSRRGALSGRASDSTRPRRSRSSNAAKPTSTSHRAGWRNDKHKYQWPATLSAYAYPVIGALPVQAVDTGLVLKVLEPIWTAKAETAGRVRQRIESVLDFAKVRG